VITHATPLEGDGIQRMLEAADKSASSRNSAAIDSTAFQNAVTQALSSIGVTNSGVSVSPSTSADNSSAASTATTTTPQSTSSSSSSGADWWAIESTPGWQAAEKAYWTDQPKAVQQLENAPQSEKGSLAASLEAQGYSIDVPIMVWGWDPLATMMMRQNDGLTWVPSALQSNIPVAPGDSFPGLASYDPNNPPPGSITVTTAFANGTNGQDPWVQNSTAASSSASS